MLSILIETQHDDPQCNDTQHIDCQNDDPQFNDTQQNDTQHIDCQHNKKYDTQHNNAQSNSQDIVVLSVVYAECHLC